MSVSPELRGDRSALVALLQELVRINSVNPDLDPTSPGEAEVGEHVAARLRSLGLEVERQPVAPGRQNVLARLRAPKGRGAILFDSHLDTQALDAMGERALSAEVRDGRLYGRGACDDKASLASMIYALELLLPHRDRLAADVLMLASVGEEHLMNGIKAFAASGVPVDAAVVGEPTDLRVVTAHKGFIRFTLTTHGRAAHTSNPEEGDNAIYQMGDVLRFIRDRLTRRGSAISHPLLGSPTLAVGRIWGGVAVNVVPDTCVIEIDRRTLPTESLEGVLAELDEGLDELRRAHPEVKLSRSEPMSRDFGLDTPTDSPIVTSALAACQAELGWAEAIGVRYGTNASTLAGVARIPTIVFGPGSILRAHTADEYVPLDEVEAAARIYARIALGWRRS